MDRLFLRVYLNVVVGILVAALAAGVLVRPRVSAQLGRNIEETFSVPTALLAEMFADRYAQHHDFGGAAERAARRFAVPFSLAPRAAGQLDRGELARLDGGAVVRTGHPHRSMLFARIEGTAEVLRLGPLSVAPPVGT